MIDKILMTILLALAVMLMFCICSKPENNNYSVRVYEIINIEE